MKTTDNQLLMKPSAGTDRLSEELETIKQSALLARDVRDALTAPTISQITLRHGLPGVGGITMAIIENGMQLFAPQRRLTSAMIGVLSDTMLTRYKHESLADLGVFLRNCADGFYDEGKTFGSLDVPLLMGWFTRYLEEKAIVREQEADRQEHVIEQRMRKDIGDTPVLMDALKKSVENYNLDSADKRLAASRERLRRDMEFTEKVQSEDPANEEIQDALVKLYQLHTKAFERSMILKACEKRGIDKAAFIARVNAAPPLLETMVKEPHTEDGTDQ